MIKYIKSLISSDTSSSSKRAISILIALIISVLSLLYTDKTNVLPIIAALSTFVISLLSVAVVQQIKNKEK